MFSIYDHIDFVSEKCIELFGHNCENIKIMNDFIEEWQRIVLTEDELRDLFRNNVRKEHQLRDGQYEKALKWLNDEQTNEYIPGGRYHFCMHLYGDLLRLHRDPRNLHSCTMNMDPDQGNQPDLSTGKSIPQ